MPLKLYNTMSKRVEAFEPLEPGQVKMYNCGLTVYDFAHVGNLRAFVFADLLRRYLEWKGFDVRQAMNFTDVGHIVGDLDVGFGQAEDKMAVAAKREKKSVWDIADFYIRAAMLDFKKMNLLEPAVRPRATEHIPEMIEMIQKLIEKGFAYIVNGSVYYDISKFPNYGKLSGNTPEQLIAGAGGRVEPNPEKRNQLDFALWVKDPQHVMHWDSPWSTGYPGWHIECSVMVLKHLGKSIDIHTGGVDNMFPHHECEIAQSEAANGVKFSNFWMHVTHLLVNGEKMSKSKGNFYTLSDIEKRGFSAKALRWLLLSAHYRTQFNLTDDGLSAAEKTVRSLNDFIEKISAVYPGATGGMELSKAVKEARKKFEESMDSDLNIAPALAALFDLMRATNKAIDENKASENDLKEVYNFFMDADRVLGVLGREAVEATEEVKSLVAKREKARAVRDWKKSDELRAQIKAKGWIVEDTEHGSRLRKV